MTTFPLYFLVVLQCGLKHPEMGLLTVNCKFMVMDLLEERVPVKYLILGKKQGFADHFL